MQTIHFIQVSIMPFQPAVLAEVRADAEARPRSRHEHFLVLDMNDSKVHPDAGSEDEHRYIRYAVARLAAFSNITWDLGDDLDYFRDEKWTHDTGHADSGPGSL